MKPAWLYKSNDECVASYADFNASTGIYCNATWDQILCWPPTASGSSIQQPCPPFKGVDPTKFAVKTCSSDGHWEDKDGQVLHSKPAGWTNYTECFIKEMKTLIQMLYSGSEQEVQTKLNIAQGTRILEMVGLSISLLSLVVSIFIFTYFRCLKNTRTKIHLNLFIAILVQVAVRLILYVDQYTVRANSDLSPGNMHQSTKFGIDNTPVLCESFYVLLEYARTAMFMWMFIEGLHLHNLTAFHVLRQKTYFIAFHFLGWGIPVAMTFLWAVATAFKFKSVSCWWGYNFSAYFWILEGPRLTVIVVNLFFLLNILRVLVTKMRNSNVNEAVQIRKACRAAVILLPLLGITNSLAMIHGPLQGSPLEFALWSYGTHFLTSFQGFFIALIYCFLNGEVEIAICKCWRNYKTPSQSPKCSVSSRNIDPKTGNAMPRHCTSESDKDESLPIGGSVGYHTSE